MTDGETDGQTDRQNYDSQDRARIAASRGKNVSEIVQFLKNRIKFVGSKMIYVNYYIIIT